jgi:hypothetical protein
VSIVYRLRDKVESARLTIVDSAGKAIAVLPCATSAGTHRINWNLRRAEAEVKPSNLVAPGEYRVQLQVGTATLTRTVRVKLDE